MRLWDSLDCTAGGQAYDILESLVAMPSLLSRVIES